MWHQRSEEYVKAGKIQSLGIVQEQHPDRAALFMQWQKMDWPVLSDPFNLLGVKVVPITLLVDSSGIIRFQNPSAKDLETFVETVYPRTLIQKGDFAFDSSLEARKKELEKDQKDAVAQFRYGVSLRQRFDSDKRKDGDFSGAVEAWKSALKHRPDQYIWRRRIQQYGPRLDKPYSFYDWVNEARKDLAKRGEIPHPLVAEPRGSEFAYPAKGGDWTAAQRKHPDPGGKVPGDARGLVSASAVVVPSTKGQGGAVRVHLRFKPSIAKKVHWTNDAGNVDFFLDSAEGVSIHDFHGPGNPPAVPASAEERTIEFELRSSGEGKLPKELKGAAYYYVCEGVEGVCQYLRLPMAIKLSR